MAHVVLLTDTGTTLTLGGGDNYLLGEGITHYSTSFGTLLSVTGSGINNVLVNGSLANLVGGNAIHSVSSTQGLAITVSHTGSVFSTSGYYAILTEASRATVVNDGTVSAAEAIVMNGDISTINNSGTIHSNYPYPDSYAAYGVNFGGTDAALSNSGLIDAARAVQVYDNIQLSNSGSIQSTDDAIVFLLSSVSASYILNTGLIASTYGYAVLGADSLQSISNSGDILGSIDLAGGNDVLTNSGEILGVIEASAGANMIYNTGVIMGALHLGSDGDLVENTGTITGPVNLGAGADIYRGINDSTQSGDILGGIGDDSIFGGNNDDVIYGDDDADRLAGRKGNDDMYGGDGSDDMRGNDGDDTMTGNQGNDIMRGGRGDDEMSGGSGADTIMGGKGEDTLTGNGGEDVFVFARRSGDDEITDFNNNTDKLDLSAFAVTSSSDLNNAGVIVANGAGSIIDLTQIGGDGVIYVEDMSTAQWNNADFVFA